MNCPTCGIDVDNHPANRCLDAWIAEKVFGYTLRDLGWGLFFERPESGGTINVDRDAYCSFSTDIAAAWEIVKALASKGIEVIVAEGFSGNLSACMLYQGAATSYPPKDCFLHLAHIERARLFFGYLVIRTQAESVPLAICRAALKAVQNG